jgi:hypothetical protein
MGVGRAFTARHGEIMTTAHKEMIWERNFDAAQKREPGKHLLVDFSAAPM